MDSQSSEGPEGPRCDHKELGDLRCWQGLALNLGMFWKVMHDGWSESACVTEPAGVVWGGAEMTLGDQELMGATGW